MFAIQQPGLIIPEDPGIIGPVSHDKAPAMTGGVMGSMGF